MTITEVMIIPMYGIRFINEPTIIATKTMIKAMIRNAIILRIPIRFISSITAPIFNASSKLSVSANLAIATISRIENTMNKIITKTANIPNAATALFKPTPMDPVITANMSAIMIGIMKYTIFIIRALIPLIRFALKSISGKSSESSIPFLITLTA